jgi:hypothetical protein
MAGKTFPGIGDAEDESPPVDPADAADSGGTNSRPFYSGPTVVDDLKVEEGLKKLRSLDIPLGGVTGITKAVVDALESTPPPVREPHLDGPPPLPSAQVVANQLRETAVGRNVVGPTVGQQEIHPAFDDRALRGTLFGHSIHAPEFALPAPEEPPPPGALALYNRGAPTKTVMIHPPAGGAPPEAEPFERPEQFFRKTPLTPMAVRDGVPRKRLFARAALGAAGIAVIVGVALIWTRMGDDSNSTPSYKPPVASPAPPVAAPPAAAPPVAAPAVAAVPAVAPATAAAPVAPAPDSEPAPMPAVASPPAQATTPAAGSGTRPVARRAAELPEHAAGDPEPATHSHHTHTSSGHPDRRHATPETDKGSPTETSTPARTARPGRRAPEDDPDGTMAPSIE